MHLRSSIYLIDNRNKKNVRTIKKQIKKQIQISENYNTDDGLKYADLLLQHTGFDKVFFGNSGAEANEAAIKLARKYGHLSSKKRNVIVTLEKSFHGRTLATLKATGQEKFHAECFGPFPEGFRYIKANDYESLKTAFDDSVCALMLECVQGEGGVNLIDSDWAQAAAKAAREAGAIVIADEVQTGMGRTGTLLASEQLGFDPEIVTLAKGIAGGIPMGACLYKGVVSEVFVAGDHQSTFGGNPIATSAAITVLDEITKHDFLNHVVEVGNYIRNTIAAWDMPIIKEIRGKGLMIGIDIEISAGDIQKKCLEAEPMGLCISTAGPNTLRFLPPLNISYKEVAMGLYVLMQALKG